MKTQFWMSKWFMFIFAGVLLTLSVQGISYGAPGGVCQVGDVLSPGQSCTYPGTEIEFSVLDNGSGRFLFFTAGGGINARNVTINGVRYSFAASKRADGNWEIEAAGDGGGQTPAPPIRPKMMPKMMPKTMSKTMRVTPTISQLR